MSSDRPSDAPSPPPEPGAGASFDELTELVRTRGAALVDALERHLPGAREHAEGTAAYAFAAAAELGFERGRCELVREAAALHEVGLVYIPAEVVAKPAEARDAEQAAAFEGHYQAGYRLARGAGIPEQVCAWLLRQRERFGGGGPEGMAGDEIPIESRLIRAACVCQTTLAAGGNEPSLSRAIEALDSAAGAELDPGVATALRSMLERAAA